MRREFVTADPREMLQTALARLQNCGCRTLPVVEGGRLVGLVTADHLAEVLMIQEALHADRYEHRSPARADGRDRNGPHRRFGEAPGLDAPAGAAAGAADGAGRP
jgi:hypothetical protein